MNIVIVFIVSCYSALLIDLMCAIVISLYITNITSLFHYVLRITVELFIFYYCVQLSCPYFVIANSQVQYFIMVIKHNLIESFPTHLVFIGLLLMAYRHLTGIHVQINQMVAPDAPAALPRARHSLQLQHEIRGAPPAASSGRQTEHPPVHIHCPQQRPGHHGPYTT